MADPPPVLRAQLIHATKRVAAARADGYYTRIRFWLDRQNMLLDQLHQLATESRSQ
ncbi:Uncharacterised protein [Mycobacterium tuberculosis]|nr:Uncharacterised protein [Mycobacterium tuberculosis]